MKDESVDERDSYVLFLILTKVSHFHARRRGCGVCLACYRMGDFQLTVNRIGKCFRVQHTPHLSNQDLTNEYAS